MPDFSNPRDRTTEQRVNRATPFRPDQRMEDLAQLRHDRPDEYAALPPAVKIAVGLYESDKARRAEITGAGR